MALGPQTRQTQILEITVEFKLPAPLTLELGRQGGQV
jgi:hypothetical protein